MSGPVPVVELDVFDRDSNKLPFVLTIYGYRAVDFFDPASTVHDRIGEIFRRRGWRDLGYFVRAMSVREKRYTR